MTQLRTVLAFKIGFTLVCWAGPLLFAPVALFARLGFPPPPPDLLLFIRLLGMAYLALVVVYAWTSRDPRARSGGIVTGIVSNGGASAVLAFFLLTGRLSSWPHLGRAIIAASAVVTLLLAALLTVTARSILFKSGPPAPGG